MTTSHGTATSETYQSMTSLINLLANKYRVDATKLLPTLKATCFKLPKEGTEITNEQMMALLIVANEYNLNPFTGEIYAFPDKQNGIVPIVGVNGWSRIINAHQCFDGMEFVFSEVITTPRGGLPCPEWIECSMYRTDRSRPIVIREYLDETYRPPFQRDGKTINGPWQTHTKRMLRHKAMIQCGRIAFGFSGMMDSDEAERYAEKEVAAEVTHKSRYSRDPLSLDVAGNEKDAILESARFTQLMADLEKTSDPGAISVLTKSSLLTKITPEERATFNKAADAKLKSMELPKEQ